VLAGIAAVTTLALRRRRRRTTTTTAAPASTNGTGPPVLGGEDAERLEADIQSYDL
jgi:hypothetical protein